MTDFRVQHGPIRLGLTPDGTVYCDTDRTMLGTVHHAANVLTAAIDAHIAAEHTTLDGAGTPPAEGDLLDDPATFAAHWNRATEEQRADYLTRIRASSETASRCYAMNHDALRELAERQAQLLNLIRAAITDYTRNRPAAEVIDEIGLILQ